MAAVRSTLWAAGVMLANLATFAAAVALAVVYPVRKRTATLSL